MNTVMAKAFFKKTTLFASAFVLAVSTLTAAVPFVLAEQAGAVGGNVAVVTDEASLVAAAADTEVTIVSIEASFSTSQKTVFSGRNVYIDGNGNKVSFTANTPVSWNGDYVFQAYKNTVAIKNLAIAGGDAAIYANGATLNLQGVVNVSGNEFGGIEVSQGNGVSTPAVLNAGTTLVNSTESNAKPTAWTDQVSTANATVNGNFTSTTHIGTNQKQYYLNNVNTGTAVTNTTRNTTFTSLEAAIAAATYGDSIELNKDLALTSMVFINKGLKIDGKGHTVTALFSYTQNSVDNAVLTINGNDVVLKNVTTDNTSTGQHPHGLSVHNASGVTLENLTFKNGRAGATIVKSTVVAKNLHTIGNTWGGINVDNGGTSASFTISGANTYNNVGTAPMIWVDNRTNVSIVDTDDRYDVISNGLSDVYVFDVIGPSISWQVQPAPVVGETFHVRPITSGENITTKSVYIDSTDPANLCWTLTSNHLNFDTSNESCPMLAASLTNGTHKFVAVFADVNGNKTISDSNSFTVDRSGPTITVKPESNGNATSGIFKNVSFKFFDANKVDKLTINGVVKDLTNDTYSDLNNVKPGQFGAVEGTNTLIVFDTLGNKSTLTFTLDVSGPTTPVANAPTGLNKAPTEFTWTGSTDPSGPVTYEVITGVSTHNLDNGKLTNGVSVKGTGITATSLPATFTDGIFFWQVQATDALGNKSAWSNIQGVTIDQTGPSAPVAVGPTGLNKTASAFTWNASTDPSAPITYEVITGVSTHNLDNGKLTNGVTVIASGVSGTSLNHTFTDGTFFWQVQATDALGNKSAWSNIQGVTIDSVVAAPTLVSPTDGAFVNGTSVTQTWSTTESDIYRYIYESYNDAAATQLRFTDTYIGTSKTANDVANGTVYYWRVKAVDHAGNISAPSDLWKITIDNQAPTAPGTPAATTSFGSRVVTWNWAAATDTLSGVRNYEYAFVAQGDTPSTWTPTTNTSVQTTAPTDGSYELYVRAYDNVGYPSAAAKGSVTVDTTGPEVTVNNATYTTNQPTLTGTVDSDADSVEVTVLDEDGVEVEAGDAEYTTGATTWSYTLTAPLANGNYTVVAKAFDAAGNPATSETADVTVAVVTPAATPTTPTPLPEVLATVVTTPAIINPAAAVLGNATDNDAANNAGVEGVSTENADTLAAADSEANKGTFLGLGWYWWILIIAALAAVAWWIAAAIRKRQEQEA